MRIERTMSYDIAPDGAGTAISIVGVIDSEQQTGRAWLAEAA